MHKPRINGSLWRCRLRRRRTGAVPSCGFTRFSLLDPLLVAGTADAVLMNFAEIVFHGELTEDGALFVATSLPKTPRANPVRRASLG
jgi:hypothetical protein